MITILVPDCNTISQKFYDDTVNSVDIRQLQCPSCGHHGSLIHHGSYSRTVRTGGEPVRLSILRVKCSCGATHAILLSSIVPYSQIPAETQRLIAQRAEPCSRLSEHDFDDIMDDSLDWDGIRSVIRAFRNRWRQRLLSAGIRLSSGLSHVARLCFAVYGRQFMQIKRIRNTLFVIPT